MKKLILAAAAGLLSVSAMASGHYSGTFVQHVDLGVKAPALGATHLDDTGTGIKLMMGQQLNKHFAVEGSYAYMSGAHLTTGAQGKDVKAHEAAVALVGSYPLTHKVTALGKVSVVHTNLSGDVDGSRNTIGMGVGMDYHVAKGMAIRTELERVNRFANTGADATRFSVGFIKRY